jgi:septum formation protein
MSTIQVVLASQSPQRKLVMDTLGIEYVIAPADLDEKAIVASDPAARAALVARRKAEVVKASYPQAAIIAADTYVVLGDTTLEKPENLDEAREMLRAQSGQWAVEHSGFCYLDPNHAILVNRTASTRIKFRELSAAEIDRYVSEYPVTTWSAAFSPAYPAGLCLIEQIEGSLTSFTHGLPMEWVVECLRNSEVFI